MVETIVIESADDGAPIPPKLLRELRNLLLEDDELDLGVKLRDRAPAPGEQGAVADAVEIVGAATPLATIFADVVKTWIVAHKLSVKLRGKGGTEIVDFSGAQRGGLSSQQVERLLAKVIGADDAEQHQGE